MILVRFEVTLLETKYIACEIVNRRSLNVKNRVFRGPTKTHPSGMSGTAVRRVRRVQNVGVYGRHPAAQNWKSRSILKTPGGAVTEQKSQTFYSS